MHLRNVVARINYNVVYTADYSISVHIFSYICFTVSTELPYFSSGTLSNFVVTICHLIFLSENIRFYAQGLRGYPPPKRETTTLYTAQRLTTTHRQHLQTINIY